MDEEEIKYKSKLKSLIYTLKTDNTIFVSNKKMLISTLQDLDNVIGMKRLKDKVAQQVNLLLYQNKLKQSKDINYKKKMLNVIFYGPPGTGKSSIGVIYARILYAMGYIGGGKSRSVQPENNNLNNTTKLINSFIILSVVGYLFTVISKHLNRYILYLMIGILILIGIVIIYQFFCSNSNKTPSVKQGEISRGGTVKDSDIFSLVSREDLVAGYVGQTAPKTAKVLNDNRGKVLFIDEAYSLCHDNRDPFGKECLDTMTKFLSENPEYVCIFAGYKNKIKETILKFQPGLLRRCMFIMETDKYNGEELYEIFRTQLKKDGFSDDFDEDVQDFFVLNEENFVNYGGDTERLVYYSQLFHSEDNLHGNKLSNKLTLKNIEDGFNELMNNNERENQNEEVGNEVTKDYIKIDRKYIETFDNKLLR